MFNNFNHMLEELKKTDNSLFDLIITEECLVSGESRKNIIKRAHHAIKIMWNSLEKGNTLDINLPIKESIEQSQKMMGAPIFLSKDLKEACYWAMSIMEYSNGMGVILAAPTAGSSGIFPACIFKAKEMLNKTEDDIVEAYFIGGTIGAIIGNNATLSGSEGGCQAEVGVSSAMAAAALSYLGGGTALQIVNSVALAMQNLMGLVCDPVAGLVISPCIQRNTIGVMNAFLAAEMALSGVVSIIPPDEVVDAMKKVGRMLPMPLKETGKGGIANTPTGRRLKREIFGKKE